MGIGGEALRIWTALGVGTRSAGGCPPRPRGCHRLPPSAKGLPPSAKALPPSAIGLPLSAKTCHPLPRAASFLRHPRRSTGPLRNSVVKGGIAILQRGLKLWRIDVAQRTGMRSGASDLLLENEGEGTPSPVTVCHINLEGWPRETLAWVPRTRTKSTALSKTVRPWRTGLNGQRPRANRGASRLFATTIRRQIHENNQQYRDLWRQPTTESGPSKRGGGGCFTWPAIAGAAMKFVGTGFYLRSYGDRWPISGGCVASPCADAIRAAGAENPPEPRQKTTNVMELQNPAL